jgi:hypothetical protein
MKLTQKQKENLMAVIVSAITAANDLIEKGEEIGPLTLALGNKRFMQACEAYNLVATAEVTAQ